MTTNEDYHWVNTNEKRKEIAKPKANKKFNDEASAKYYLLNVAKTEKLSDYNDNVQFGNYIDLANSVWNKKSKPYMRGQCVLEFCKTPKDCTCFDGCLKSDPLTNNKKQI